MVTPGVNPDRKLPAERQDICKFCGSPRLEENGFNGKPRCPKQGCPGQQV